MPDLPPAVRRLSQLAPLDDIALAALGAAVDRTRIVRHHREIMAERTPVTAVRIIVSGWAAQVRLLSDGRRQILGFLLPGDLIGLYRQPDPLSASSVTALTDVEVCLAPTVAQAPALEVAYSISEAMEHAYLLDQVARLGRLNAQERITSLLLELHERFTLNGLAQGDSFPLPLTQETLADALGLTPVHVNRMLQQVRRSGEVQWEDRRVTLSDSAALASAIGRRPVRVSQSAGP